MRITHPDLPDRVADVPDSVYRDVLRHRDWKPAADPLDTGDKTVAQVLDEVGHDPARARLALESERGGLGRTTLISQLEKVAHTKPAPAPEAATPEKGRE